MYLWIVFLHVLAAFGFLLGHGATAFVMVRLPHQTQREQIRTLIEVHDAAARVGFISLGIMIFTGVVAGIWFNWWQQGWIWVALVLLVAIWIAMRPIGTDYFSRVQRVIGKRPHSAKKNEPDPIPGTDAEVRAVVATGKPSLLLGIGLVGWISILWLMMFKPF